MIIDLILYTLLFASSSFFGYTMRWLQEDKCMLQIYRIGFLAGHEDAEREYLAKFRTVRDHIHEQIKQRFATRDTARHTVN